MSTLSKLMLTPNQDSYSVSRNHPGYVRTDLEGGAGRYRRDLEGSTQKITVKWTLDKNDYTYLCAFYRTFLDSMTGFRIDLIVEDEGLAECRAWFMPGTMKLNRQRGHIYESQATLEVETPEYDIELDYALVHLVGMIGRNWRKVFDKLDTLVNIDWPRTLPI
jgi:hypothetical protein